MGRKTCCLVGMVTEMKAVDVVGPTHQATDRHRSGEAIGEETTGDEVDGLADKARTTEWDDAKKNGEQDRQRFRQEVDIMVQMGWATVVASGVTRTAAMGRWIRPRDDAVGDERRAKERGRRVSE